jgi:hypothetical protein
MGGRAYHKPYTLDLVIAVYYLVGSNGMGG